MCGRKSLRLFALLLLLSLLSPQLGFCDVVLTDEEAQTILTELEESRKDLDDAMMLSEGLRSELRRLQEESEELRKSYERRFRAQRTRAAVTTIAAASICLAGGITIGYLASR